LARRPGSAAEDGQFTLTIPSVKLFQLDVRPTIVVAVSVRPQGEQHVRIRVLESRVDGAWATQLRLNSRFLIWGDTLLRWPGGCALSSRTDLRVGVDPPAPFSAIPRPVLRAVGDAVLNAVCAQLQRVFLRSLAADYAAWAADSELRAQRGG
jgi:hypothetical protein